MKCIICKKEIEESRYSNKDLCSSECHNIDFWNDYVLRANEKKIARIDGSHYVISPDNPNAAFKGFGGREFTIKFNDGRIVTTRNLWHQGTIPEDFKNRLPDNAVFVQPNQN